MTDVKEHRAKVEVAAIQRYPQDYGEGVLKGAEVYEQCHTREYIAKVADRNLNRKGSSIRGCSYCCGLWEGFNEAEINDTFCQTHDIAEQCVWCERRRVRRSVKRNSR